MRASSRAWLSSRSSSPRRTRVRVRLPKGLDVVMTFIGGHMTSSRGRVNGRDAGPSGQVKGTPNQRPALRLEADPVVARGREAPRFVASIPRQEVLPGRASEAGQQARAATPCVEHLGAHRSAAGQNVAQGKAVAGG